MNDLLCAVAELFQASFQVLELASQMPNILLSLVGTAALAFCMKVATAEKNICE